MDTALWIMDCGNIPGGINTGNTCAQLVIHKNSLIAFVHHGQSTTFCQRGNRFHARAHHYQLAGDHLVVVRYHSCNCPDVSGDTQHLRFAIYTCPCLLNMF